MRSSSKSPARRADHPTTTTEDDMSDEYRPLTDEERARYQKVRKKWLVSNPQYLRERESLLEAAADRAFVAAAGWTCRPEDVSPSQLAQPKTAKELWARLGRGARSLQPKERQRVRMTLTRRTTANRRDSDGVVHRIYRISYRVPDSILGGAYTQFSRSPVETSRARECRRPQKNASSLWTLFPWTTAFLRLAQLGLLAEQRAWRIRDDTDHHVSWCVTVL
jgi:hypothetical protein